ANAMHYTLSLHGALPIYPGAARLVLPGLLDPRAGSADRRAEAGGGPSDPVATRCGPLPPGAAAQWPPGGADHQRPPRFPVPEDGAGTAAHLVPAPDQLPRLRLSQGGAALLAGPAL